MSWFSVIKKELPFNDLVNEVLNGLDDYFRSNLEVSGDYDDEKEGYRDARTRSDYLKYPDAEIRIEPGTTHDEDDDITVEYDIYFNDVRLGSYTGTDGHYIAAEDWKEYDRKDLEELLEALK